MFGKKNNLKIVNASLRPYGLKEARKNGLGGEVMAHVW